MSILDFCNRIAADLEMFTNQRHILNAYYNENVYSLSYLRNNTFIRPVENESYLNDSGQLVPASNNNKHLLGIMGRRTGKTFLLARMIAYQAYNSTSGTIGVFTPSAAQSAILYNEVSEVLRLRARDATMSPEFAEPHMLPEARRAGGDNGSITFKGNPVRIQFNQMTSIFPEARYGGSYQSLFFDEMASFYGNQNELFNSVLANMDKRIVILSSAPHYAIGSAIYRLAIENRFTNTLMFRAPTWDINPNVTHDSLVAESQGMAASVFRTEYGSEWRQVPIPITRTTAEIAVDVEDTIVVKKIAIPHKYPFGRRLEV